MPYKRLDLDMLKTQDATLWYMPNFQVLEIPGRDNQLYPFVYVPNIAREVSDTSLGPELDEALNVIARRKVGPKEDE